MARKKKESQHNTLILDEAGIAMIDDIVNREMSLETQKKALSESIKEDKKALASRLCVSPSDLTAVINLVKKEKTEAGAIEQGSAIIKAASDVILNA